MRRYLLIFLLLTFSGAFASVSVWGITVGTDSSDTSLSGNSSFISTGDHIKKLEARRTEILSSLKLEKPEVHDIVKKKTTLAKLVSDIESLLQDWSQLSINKIQLSARTDLTMDESSQLKNLSIELEAKQSDISQKMLGLSRALSFGPLSPDTPFADLQKDFPTMKHLADNTLREYDVAIADSEKKKKETWAAQQLELDSIASEINRLQQVRHDQIIQTSKQALTYVLIFFAIYCAKIVSLRMFKKFGRWFSKSHQEAIRLVHRWVFNILFVGVFLVLFAAELLSFLPFVAILGTAVGLALRDVIYSFIGWFAVGSNSWYQEGDFIEFEGTQGRVYHITPLLTNIEEYGIQGFTGKIISFPNKTIFEKNVKNWSRGSDFSLMSLEFLMTHTSNTEKAKEILMKVVYKKDLSLYYQFRKEILVFKNTFGYSDDDLKPQIHVMVEPRWIMLRIRVLVHVRDKLAEQARIMESFTQLVQKESDIAFRQV